MATPAVPSGVWLVLDCAVEDTPRWRELTKGFQNLVPSEQKWALEEALRIARRAFDEMDDRPARVKALFEHTQNWALGRRPKRFLLAAKATFHWARHPWGRVGQARKNARKMALDRLRAPQLRLESWKNFIILSQVGPAPLERLLREIAARMEAEELRDAAASAAKRTKLRHKAARVVCFPIYAMGWVAGIARAQWAAGRADGFERRSGQLNSAERPACALEKPAVPKPRQGARRL